MELSHLAQFQVMRAEISEEKTKFHQLLKDTVAFPSPKEDVMSTVYSGSNSGSPTSWTSLKLLPIARRHSGQMV